MAGAGLWSAISTQLRGSHAGDPVATAPGSDMPCLVNGSACSYNPAALPAFEPSLALKG